MEEIFKGVRSSPSFGVILSNGFLKSSGKDGISSKGYILILLDYILFADNIYSYTQFRISLSTVKYEGQLPLVMRQVLHMR